MITKLTYYNCQLYSDQYFHYNYIIHKVFLHQSQDLLDHQNNHHHNIHIDHLNQLIYLKKNDSLTSDLPVYPAGQFKQTTCPCCGNCNCVHETPAGQGHF